MKSLKVINPIIAHRYELDGEVKKQLLKDHLLNTRSLCETYGKSLGLKYVCGLAGWLHDVGKYSKEFQDYIYDIQTSKKTVIHAFGGARLFSEVVSDYGYLKSFETLFCSQLIENVIMAHHNSKGPYDYADPLNITEDGLVFRQKMNEKISDWTVSELKNCFFAEFDEKEFKSYIKLAFDEIKKYKPEFLIQHQLYFLRTVASCLIDADHLDTARSVTDETHEASNTKDTLQTLCDRFEKSTYELSQKKASNSRTQKLNLLRQKMSDESFKAGQDVQGIYKLSIPTGGGKTFSSLRFALQQASKNNYERIIYIVPYTTIIEQNAAAIRKALGLNQNDYSTVLEYHGVVNEDSKDARYYYAKDTWDAPIVVTTQVAYLNALYGSGSKNIRHMHRLLSAVLIFDEVQTLPLKVINMNNAFLTWVNRMKYGTSLLCTATQPALDLGRVDHENTEKSGVYLDSDIYKAKEIVPDLANIEKQFKRVKLETHLEKPMDLYELIDFIERKMDDVNSMLVVLNTKDAVKLTYENFKEKHADDISIYYLTTNMCAEHRKVKFKEIKKDLTQARQRQKKVVVFSTRLIEAGVDLSFESAIRSLIGLDSVVQTAGRCNRNNETELATTYLIHLADSVEKISYHLEQIRKTADITTNLANVYKDDELISSKIIREYFKSYYGNNANELNYPLKEDRHGKQSLYGLGHITSNQIKIPNLVTVRALREELGSTYDDSLQVASQTIAKKFQVIDAQTTPVIVPYETDAELDGVEIIKRLQSQHTKFNEISKLLKEAQKYSVQVYGDPSKISGNAHLVNINNTSIWIANNYDKDIGLTDELSFNFF